MFPLESPRIIDARRRFVTDVLTLAESHDVENNPVFSSFVRSRIRITQDSSLRLRLSNPLHDGLNSSELTFLFLTGHWPSDLLSRFQHHYLGSDFEGFTRSLFKLIRTRLWNEVWVVWRLVVLPP